MDPFPNDTGSYLAQRLHSALPGRVLALLRRAASLAAERGWSLFLVGGYVRDVLLKIPDYDVDVSVVGDALELAETLSRDTGRPLTTHGRFGTAALQLEGGLDLDIVTARRETYPSPGALPVVEPGSIEDDLARRDFTVNALAVEVLPEGTGKLLDPYNGVRDLKSRLIRVLHANSFVDDPTRIFRAVKLAARLDFKIELATLELILQAVRDGVLATVSIDRIVHELLLIMEEPKADVILAELEKLGVLRASHPGLLWPYPPGHIKPAERPDLTAEARRDTYLAILGAEYAHDPQEAEAVARSLHLPAPLISLLRDSARLAHIWPELGQEGQTPAQTYKLLHALDEKAVEAYGRIEALTQDNVAWERLQRYLAELRHIHAEVTGDYIKSLGVPPGPHYKRALDALLEARLNGQVRDRAEEERFLRGWLASEGVLPANEKKKMKDE